MSLAGNYNYRSSGILDEQNDNILPLVYTLEIEINLLDFDPDYPKNPRNLGEKIRKARMDKGLMIKELAAQLGVSEDTVINWEVRGRKPIGSNMENVRRFIDNFDERTFKNH